MDFYSTTTRTSQKVNRFCYNRSIFPSCYTIYKHIIHIMRFSNTFTAAIFTLAFYIGNATARPSGPPSPVAGHSNTAARPPSPVAGSSGAAAGPTSPKSGEQKQQVPVCLVQLLEGDLFWKFYTARPGELYAFAIDSLSGSFITAKDCTIKDVHGKKIRRRFTLKSFAASMDLMTGELTVHGPAPVAKGYSGEIQEAYMSLSTGSKSH